MEPITLHFRYLAYFLTFEAIVGAIATLIYRFSREHGAFLAYIFWMVTHITMLLWLTADTFGMFHRFKIAW